MTKVIKKNGVFTLEPDPRITARSRSVDDKLNLKNEVSQAELKEILTRILERLEALEK